MKDVTDGAAMPALVISTLLCVYLRVHVLLFDPTNNVWHLVYGSENALEKEREKRRRRSIWEGVFYSLFLFLDTPT